MSDYRVRISIRNERLLSAIEEAGYPSARQCSIANGYKNYLIGNLVSGVIKPLDTKTGKPTKFCKEVLKILGKNIEDCFTERQLQGFKKSSYQIKVDEKELKQLVSHHKNQGDTLLEADLDRKITQVLSIRLSPREEKVIRMHYGLGRYKEHGIIEISEHFGVSRSRMDQILLKAIRKLQHPVTKGLLLSTGFYEKFTKVDVDAEEINQSEKWLQRRNEIY
jgi:RNA polymerase sigma factor (sigma-70 family)